MASEVKLPRWQRLAILAALITAGCNFPIPMWPDMPSHGTCRNFALTSWGGGGPWDEMKWGGQGRYPPAEADHVWIDEPMLPQWGWKGSLDSAEDVCGDLGLGMVRGRIAKLREATPGVRVWLNWSTDELDAIARHCPGTPYGQGADIVSFDSYGGPWDWPGRTEYLLDMLYRQLEPGQVMGLVPEAWREPEHGFDPSPIDLVMIAHLYMHWALNHDHEGKVYAVAPFRYHSCLSSGGAECIEDIPQVAQVWSAFAVEYPRCPQ